MSTNNPQDKYMKVSKKFVIAQDFLGFITLVLAIFQGITLVIPGKIFLTISGIILVMEYIASYLSSVYFDKAHVIREIGLLDNSFSEKRIPVKARQHIPDVKNNSSDHFLSPFPVFRQPFSSLSVKSFKSSAAARL